MNARTTLMTAFAVAAFAAPVRAETPAEQPSDVGDLEGLLNESIVTTASKTAQTSSSAPATSVTLTAEDLRRYGIHTVAEAIAFLSLGGTASERGEIGTRGLVIADDRGSHVLLLVNGHAVNEQLFGSARFDHGMGIPLEMIDHIELILGPGAVLYGSNAMFGVLNVVTKAASAVGGTYVLAESELTTSLRAGAGGGYDFSLFGKPASLTLGLEYYEQTGPKITLPLQSIGADPVTHQLWRVGRDGTDGFWGGPNRGEQIRVPSGLLRFKWKDLEVNGGASLYKLGAPFGLSRRLEPGGSNYNDPDMYESELRVWVDARQRIRVSKNAEVLVRPYADSFEYRRVNDVSAAFYCQFSGVDTCRKQTLGVSRWAGTELQLALDWFNDEHFTTLLGVDARVRYAGHQVDWTNHDTGEYLQSSTSILSRTDGVVGAYAEQTWRPNRVFGLNAGARFDAYTEFGKRLSPRVAATLTPWAGGTLKAVYSEAYRAPTYFEADLTNANQIRARDLSPESVRSAELSLDQKIGTHRLVFGGFRSWWSDLIQLQTLSADELRQAQRNGEAPFSAFTATQFRNVSSIDSYGYN
ncbi:MAG TPA: TonB-dependent receptor, partial [Polyangiaceae bacterium]